MTNVLVSPIQRWSTANVDASQRLAYYSEALSTALTPMEVSARDLHPRDFCAETSSVSLGSVQVLHQTGSASQAYRGARDIARSQEHSYHLIVNLIAPWNIEHRGNVRLEPGDAIFTDSHYGHRLDMLAAYEVVNLRFSEDWIRSWIPAPAVLTGRKIPATCRWARPLAAFVTQLSPEFVVNALLPGVVIADQVGALLALIANEMSGAVTQPTRQERAMRDQIQDCIVQRCSETSVVAEEIAKSLNISTRTLHRSLAACGRTFGASLLGARLDLATRMLESPVLKRLTTAEIGRRAGFADASHFARAFKKRSGRTPAQLRRDLWAI